MVKSRVSLLLIVAWLASHSEASNHPECGLKRAMGSSGIATRIIGGEEAIPHEFPWMAHLWVLVDTMQGSRAAPICGASILNERWILTAAHCVLNKTNNLPNKIDMFIDAGKHRYVENNAMFHEPTEFTSMVDQFIPHPDFTFQNSDADVAVLKLKTPIKFNKAIGPICLPDSENLDRFAGHKCINAGWGNVDVYGKKGTASPVLKKVTAKLWKQSDCNPMYDNALTDRMLCWGQLGLGACSGDSGGPLVCLDRAAKRWMQYGVNSFGRVCGGEHPTVVARISELSEWIWETIEEIDDDDMMD